MLPGHSTELLVSPAEFCFTSLLQAPVVGAAVEEEEEEEGSESKYQFDDAPVRMCFIDAVLILTTIWRVGLNRPAEDCVALLLNASSEFGASPFISIDYPV